MLLPAAPQAEDFGQYLQVTFKLVDAAEWVEIYNKRRTQRQKNRLLRDVHSVGHNVKAA